MTSISHSEFLDTRAVVHYPIALWLQYWLFDCDLPAIVKVAIGLVLTVALSWVLTRTLRQIPGATMVL